MVWSLRAVVLLGLSLVLGAFFLLGLCLVVTFGPLRGAEDGLSLVLAAFDLCVILSAISVV